MIIDYIGVKEINGSLITLDGIRDATFEETVLIRLENGTERSGRIVQMEGDRVVIQVFEGTNGLSLSNTRTRLQGHPVDVTGAGRTDAGVHARAMTANVVLDVEETPEAIRDYLNRYLPDTIKVFPQGEVMKGVIARAGFSEVNFKRLTFGICTLYTATK